MIAVDVDDNKLELAKRLGAHYTINSVKENLHERTAQVTNQRGADVIIEAVDRPKTYIASIAEVKLSQEESYISVMPKKKFRLTRNIL